MISLKQNTDKRRGEDLDHLLLPPLLDLPLWLLIREAKDQSSPNTHTREEEEDLQCPLLLRLLQVILWMIMVDIKEQDNILRLHRARDKRSIRVKYPNVLSKYSVIFENLGIDTQLIWQSTQLFPNSRVKIKSFKARKAHDYYFIVWLLHLICVFILHKTNIIIKLIRYNEIPWFKYLSQHFLCSFFLFYKFYPIRFHFELGGAYLYSNRKIKIQFYPID